MSGQLNQHHSFRQLFSYRIVAEHHASVHAAIGHHVGRDLQRADHRGPGSAGIARREVPCGGSGRAAAAQPADLRPGWDRGTVHRHQGDRPDADRFSYLCLKDQQQCSRNSVPRS